MTEKTRLLLLATAEAMLRYVKDRPRWPGAAARPSHVESRLTFSEMDEYLNEAEVAYWEGRVAYYTKVRTKKVRKK